MINRKLFLTLTIICISLDLCCMQDQQELITALRRNQDINNQITQTKNHLRNQKNEKQYSYKEVLSLFILGGIGCSGLLSYKLANIILRHSSSLNAKPFILLSAFYGGALLGGALTSASAFLFSNYTHLLGLPHAIANRLNPQIKITKQRLYELHAQEAEQRNTIIQSQGHINDHIHNLEERARELENNRAQARQNNAQAMQQIHNNMNTINEQLRQANEDCKNLFEQHVNRLYNQFKFQGTSDIDLTRLGDGLIHYVNQLPNSASWSQHSIQVLDHAVTIYRVALMSRHNRKPGQPEKLLEAMNKISQVALLEQPYSDNWRYYYRLRTSTELCATQLRISE